MTPRRISRPSHGLGSSVPSTAPVFLVGFMGSGKSSVGECLSHLLRWPFHDLDARIETRTGRAIAQIFSDSGEAAFRRLETETLAELLALIASTPAVVALGGGTFAQADNLTLLHRSGGTSVFLDAPADELWLRCSAENRNRPLMRDQNQFRQLYEARRSSYMSAGLCIDTSAKQISAVASEIALQLGLDPLKEK